MKILLYGINYAPELTGIGKYSGEMGAWLASQDHQVKAVTAPPYYPQWKIADGYRNGWSREKVEGVDVYRCPLFVPAEPRTLTRLLHLISFALTSFLVLARLLFWRPQVIFVVEPTLFCLPGAWLYARLAGAKLVLHVQDYEMDAMFGLGMMGEGRVARIAKAVERGWMRRVDVLSTISRSMMNLAASKGVPPGKIMFFPNWVDASFITPEADSSFYRKLWGIPDSTKVVLYSGNMGKKQGLEMVVEAAAGWRHRSDVLFMMVGQGAACEDLKTMARDAGLNNMRFEPLQPYEQLPQLLALADVHLVVQKRGAADVVLPSKLTGILSAGGHALITAEPETELGLLCKEYPGIAECVMPESLQDFIVGLEKVLAGETRQTNMIARQYAERNLNKDAVLDRFVHDIAKV